MNLKTNVIKTTSTTIAVAAYNGSDKTVRPSCPLNMRSIGKTRIGMAQRSTRRRLGENTVLGAGGAQRRAHAE